MNKVLFSNNAFFLKGTDGLGAKLHLHFFAINNNSLGLKIRFPDFLSMAL